MGKPRMLGAPRSGKAVRLDARWQRKQAEKRIQEHLETAKITMAVFGGSDTGFIQDLVKSGKRR